MDLVLGTPTWGGKGLVASLLDHDTLCILYLMLIFHPFTIPETLGHSTFV